MINWSCVTLPYQADGAKFFQSLLACDYPIWLDSCAHAELGRYDVFSAAPSKHLSQLANGLITCSDPNIRIRENDFLDELKHHMCVDPGSAGDFSFSGALGYFSYEFGVKQHQLHCHNPSPYGLPEAWFGFYDWAIIVDHHRQTATLLYHKIPTVLGHKDALVQRWHKSFGGEELEEDFNLLSSFSSNLSYFEYEAALADISKEICLGNTYQVNFSQCFSAPFEGDPFTAYNYLRHKNPSEYAVFLRMPEGDILSFSPELLVKGQEKHIQTKPIKGTSARNLMINSEQVIKETLRSCPKNCAENTMIVDLIRNDLSRIAEIDSVQVDDFLSVETLPSVFHLVSTVSATLLEGLTYLNVIDALFPGGSITGAPKYKTMQLIEHYEKQARGIYCGSIGHLSVDKQMCFNIAIRTITAVKGTLYCPAGGGIVLDSNVQNEYQETQDKVSILTKALHQYTQI